MSLSPDEIECLVAIDRRSPVQEKLVSLCGTSLADRGFITMDHGWPQVTLLGRAELDKIAFGVVSSAHAQSSSATSSSEADGAEVDSAMSRGGERR